MCIRDSGKRGAADVEQLLTQTRALFAGGDVPEEDKELFFQAVTEAYFALSLIHIFDMY